MKFQYLAIVLSLFTGVAHAATQYELSITNGSNMPISPAVIAVQNRASSETLIGQTASTGLVQLCQSIRSASGQLASST